jgi:hypothetical protein
MSDAQSEAYRQQREDNDNLAKWRNQLSKSKALSDKWDELMDEQMALYSYYNAETSRIDEKVAQLRAAIWQL